MSDASPHRRPSRDRHAQSRQARRDARTACALWHRRHIGGRTRSGEPDETGMTFRDNARIKAQAAALRPACPPSPTIPAWWSMRSTAHRASIRRAGPGPEKNFRRAMATIEVNFTNAAPRRPQAQRPFRLGALRRVARRPRRGFRGRVDGTLVWPPRGDKGFGYDPMFLPDGHTAHLGKCRATRSTACRRAAKVCRIAPAPL